MTLDCGLILLTVAKSGSVQEGMDLADDVDDQGAEMVLDIHYYYDIYITMFVGLNTKIKKQYPWYGYLKAVVTRTLKNLATSS